MTWNDSSDLLGVYDIPEYPTITQTPEVHAVIWILSILSITGTAGNAVVLYVFYQKKDKQVSTMFIIVLAFVDFTTCLIVIPFTIILEARDFMIQYDFVCKLYQFMITSNIPFSALIMVAIAVDRYFCICHPFLHALNLNRAKLLTVAMAMFSASLGVIVSLMYGVYNFMDRVMMPVPAFNRSSLSGGGGGNDTNVGYFQDFAAFYNNYPVDERGKFVVFVGQCRTNELIIGANFMWYYQRFYMVLYLVSLVVVIILYVLIYHSVMVRRNRRERQKSKALPLVQLQNETAQMSTVEETLLTQVNGDDKAAKEDNTDNSNAAKIKTAVKGSLNRKSTKKDNNRMANLKTAAMLFVVTVVFVITFLPALLMTLDLIPYNMTVFYMYFANNVANPVIYSFMNKNFRDDLKKIFFHSRQR